MEPPSSTTEESGVMYLPMNLRSGISYSPKYIVLLWRVWISGLSTEKVRPSMRTWLPVSSTRRPTSGLSISSRCLYQRNRRCILVINASVTPASMRASYRGQTFLCNDPRRAVHAPRPRSLRSIGGPP